MKKFVPNSNFKVHVLKTQWIDIKNYCYIIENHQSKEVILIDPSSEFHTIDNMLKQTHTKPKAILLTHHHDHVHLEATQT